MRQRTIFCNTLSDEYRPICYCQLFALRCTVLKRTHYTRSLFRFCFAVLLCITSFIYIYFVLQFTDEFSFCCPYSYFFPCCLSVLNLFLLFMHLVLPPPFPLHLCQAKTIIVITIYWHLMLYSCDFFPSQMRTILQLMSLIIRVHLFCSQFHSSSILRLHNSSIYAAQFLELTISFGTFLRLLQQISFNFFSLIFFFFLSRFHFSSYFIRSTDQCYYFLILRFVIVAVNVRAIVCIPLLIFYISATY